MNFLNIFLYSPLDFIYVLFLYMTKNDENFTEIFVFSEIQRNAQIGLSDFEQKHKTKAKISLNLCFCFRNRHYPNQRILLLLIRRGT